jgi:Methyltransferase domain
MPVDRDAWRRDVHLVNFVNAYYECRDIEAIGRCRTVLLVGPGNGLETTVLRWRGLEVTTLDIDETFAPEHVGSVHDLSRFRSGMFDVVLASHVLEHLAVSYLDPALAEIARVGRYALVYLPVHGRHAQLRAIAGVRDLDLSLEVDLFNYFERPDGVTPRYMGGQHFWEVGMRGFRVRDLRRRFLAANFDIVRDYRNRDWLPSYNFVLRSRSVTAPPPE